MARGTWQGSGTWQTTGGGGVGMAAVVIALAVIGAVIHAIWHTLIEVAEIVVWTMAGIVGLAVVAGLGYAAFRIRASMASRRTAPKAVIISNVIHGSIRADRPSAIEAPQRTSWPLPGQWEEIQPDINRSES